MSKDPPNEVPSVFVTADDGTVFSCTPHRIDGDAGQIRWKLIDPTGREYLGPAYVRAQSRAELQRMVAYWWDANERGRRHDLDEPHATGGTSATVVVKADDGTVFHCTPCEIGSHPARHSRWKLVEPDGMEHAGPFYTGFTSQADIRRMVSDWWEAKKALGRPRIDPSAGQPH